MTGPAAPDYATAGLGGSCRWSRDVALNAAFYNLTGKRLDTSTCGKINYGWRRWVSASLRF